MAIFDNLLSPFLDKIVMDDPSLHIIPLITHAPRDFYLFAEISFNKYFTCVE